MPKFLFTLLLLFIEVNNKYQTNGEFSNNSDIPIKPGIWKTLSIKYQEINLKFTKDKEFELQINIH